MNFEQDTLSTNNVKMPSLRYATESFGDQWEFNALVD